MLHSACSIKYFPLTPCLRRSRRGRQVTLSLFKREREALGSTVYGSPTTTCGSAKSKTCHTTLPRLLRGRTRLVV